MTVIHPNMADEGAKIRARDVCVFYGDKKAIIFALPYEPPAEAPDTDYPFWLSTGRVLEHWHTGSMTRRASVLDAIEPMATASMCGADMTQLALKSGDVITIRSRRGEVVIHVRRDDGTPAGAIFMPFAYYEAAANLMTNPALDPFGKIPEFKYCAVAVTKGGKPAQFIGYELLVNDAMLIQ